MKKNVVLIMICFLLVGGGILYAAGDLTVAGKITSSQTFQAGTRIIDSTGVLQVNFPVAFNTVPVVTASGVRQSTQPLFVICIVEVTPTYFSFRARNLDGTAHAATSTDYASWIAVAQ